MSISCRQFVGGINMRKTKTYKFDKEYLVLNEMSVGYIYSEKTFSYCDSSKQSGKPCPKTKKVPFWWKVQFQKKLGHCKHKGNRIYTYRCNIYCDHACIALSNITLDAPSQIWLNGKLAFTQGGLAIEWTAGDGQGDQYI